MGMGGPVGLLKLLRLLKPPAQEVEEFGPTKAEQILETSNPILNNENTDEELVPDDMPSLQAYRDYLSKGAPKHADYKPSTGRRILGHAQGFLAGVSGQPNRVSEILNSPYNEAVEDHKNEGIGLEGAAKLDVNLENQRRLSQQAADQAKVRVQEIDRQIAESKRKEEEANRRMDAAAANAERRHQEEMEQRKKSEADAQRRHEAAMARMDKRTSSESDTTWKVDTDAQGRKIRINPDTGKSEYITAPDSSDPLMGKVTDKVQIAANALDETITKAETLEKIASQYKGTFALGPGGQGRGSEFWNRWISGDPNKSDMYRLMQDIANSSLYEKSGAQINNKEFERLRKTLADPGATEESIFSDLKGFLDSAKRQRERFQKRGVWNDDASSGSPKKSKYNVRIKGGQ